LLNRREAELELAGPHDRRRRDEFYGLRRELLDEVGPSVVSINGAAASLAVSVRRTACSRTTAGPAR